MTTNKRFALMCLALLAVLTMGTTVAQAAEAAQYAVIVGADNPASSLDSDALKRIFMGKSTMWDDGARYAVALAPPADPAVTAFLEEIVKKSPSQFETYWKKKLFSGSGTPPKTLKSMAEVVDYVGSETGASGVVSADIPANERVKVIAVQ